MMINNEEKLKLLFNDGPHPLSTSKKDKDNDK